MPQTARPLGPSNEHLVGQINITTFLVLTVRKLIKLTCSSKQFPKWESRVKGDQILMKGPVFNMTVLMVFTKSNFEQVFSRLEHVYSQQMVAHLYRFLFVSLSCIAEITSTYAVQWFLTSRLLKVKLSLTK
jgi:hypothetical protein